MRLDVRGRLWPLSASLPIAVGETLAGYAVLVVLARLLNVGGADFGGLIPALVAVGSWFWLAWWPAWRLCRVPGGFGRRLAIGSVRLIALATVLPVVGTIVARLLYQPSGDFLSRGGIALVIFLLMVGRIVVVVGASATMQVQQRLRWQLMASHVATVVLTFVTLTLAGSVLATALAYHASHANVTLMARSLSRNLQLANAAQNPSRAQSVFQAVLNPSTALRLAGEPGLNVILKHRVAPDVMVLMTPNGRVVRMAEHLSGSDVPSWSAIAAQYGSTIASLRTQALTGVAASATLPNATTASNPGFDQSAAFELGAAPVPGSGGKPVAVAMLEVTQPSLSTPLFVREALTVFSLLTVLLIVATSIPILGLSFLFSWFMARRLTQRLEDVSHVATSIAGGDLTRRAPVRTRNEIGTLAEDVNRMAAHLEHAMTESTRARDQAQDALRSRQMLVANISHELRTPLAIVRAHLDALLERVGVPAGGAGPNEVQVPVATIGALQRETLRLASLVDDLFTLSRAETGAMQIDVREVDVSRLVEDVAALMRPLAQRERAIALTVQTNPNVPPALADPDRLRQIVENLVRNAVRHTPEGGLVVIGAEKRDDRVVLSVADTGEGIPEEHLPHVFDRFYRVDEARGRGSGGAGLGLAIVREFVEMMGGTVRAESAVGEGSRFEVWLRMAETAARQTAQTAEAREADSSRLPI